MRSTNILKFKNILQINNNLSNEIIRIYVYESKYVYLYANISADVQYE